MLPIDLESNDTCSPQATPDWFALRRRQTEYHELSVIWYSCFKDTHTFRYLSDASRERYTTLTEHLPRRSAEQCEGRASANFALLAKELVESKVLSLSA